MFIFFRKLINLLRYDVSKIIILKHPFIILQNNNDILERTHSVVVCCEVYEPPKTSLNLVTQYRRPMIYCRRPSSDYV